MTRPKTRKPDIKRMLAEIEQDAPHAAVPEARTLDQSAINELIDERRRPRRETQKDAG